MPDLPPALSPGVRCVAHPSRPAVDRCPICDRPRCGADGGGSGCQVCHGLGEVLVATTAGSRERLVRAALAAQAAAMLAGPVWSEYVGAPLLTPLGDSLIGTYLAPAVVGIACGSAATAAAGEPRGPLLQRVRLLAVLWAVLGLGLGFVLEGTYRVVAGEPRVLVPYLVGALACWLWTAPPKRRVRASVGA